MLGLACRMTSDDTTRIPSQSVQSRYLAAFVVSVSRSRRRNEAIPDARFSDDQPRIGRVTLDLAAQIGDVHSKIKPRVAERALPHRREELLVREHPAGIRHQYR